MLTKLKSALLTKSSPVSPKIETYIRKHAKALGRPSGYSKPKAPLNAGLF